MRLQSSGPLHAVKGMRISVPASIQLTGFMSSPSKLRAWTHTAQQNIRRGVATEMRKAQQALRQAATGTVSRSFKVSRGTFPSAWRTRVYAEKRDSFPAVLVQSKIFWMGAQEFGASIRGKNSAGLLIPFGGLRIGFKRWRALLKALRASGSTFFRNIGGRLILFARAGAQSASGRRIGGKNISALRRGTVSGIPGLRKLKKGEAFPIAVMIRSVKLRPRYSLEAAVKPIVAQIARSIEVNVTV